MNNEKLENLLNLSLEATQREREKSEELEIGYEKNTNTWELIVKYSGDISHLEDLERGIIIEKLSNEYAIVRIPENLIAEFVANPEIEFVEKPKNLYFSLVQGIRQSCVLPVRRSPYFLEGRDVITAIIDSGIDYFHPDFRNEDGSTRILALWDQTLQPREGEKPMNFAGVWSLIGKTLIAHWQLEVKRKDFRLFQAVIPADTVRMWQELQRETAGHPQGVTQAWHRRVNFWS